ncbi:MAG: hypothetical protein C4582_00150 [Desulfobacteraceae bacterium]|nr:MAG: hypothetical protein C4582_00150 [Desulfobacteraceae bacterium]
MGSYGQRILSLFPTPFYTGTRIYFDGDMEEEGIDKLLDGLTSEKADEVISAARTLSAVKPELAFYLLLFFSNNRFLLEEGRLAQWVKVVLDLYDAQGLLPAQDFIKLGKNHPLFPLYLGSGVTLREKSSILETYANSLGKEQLVIKEGKSHYTDTTSIFLPSRISTFDDNKKDMLLYKAMVTHKYGQIHLETYKLDLGGIPDLTRELKTRYGDTDKENCLSDLRRFFSFFPDPYIACDIFNLADTVRIEAWISHNLPGLYRELISLKKELIFLRPILDGSTAITRVMDGIVRWWLGEDEELCPVMIREMIQSLFEKEPCTADLAFFTYDFYTLVGVLEGPYKPVEQIPYAGELRPEEAARERLRKRESTRLEFRRQLSKLICELETEKEITVTVPPSESSSTFREGKRVKQDLPQELMVNGKAIPVPEVMGKIIEEIYEDLGSIPSSYFTISDEMSGHHFSHLCDVSPGPANLLSETAEGVHALDEWDYRRQGYRKNWALLRETEVPDGASESYEEVLAGYGTLLRRIKRQFEVIRQNQVLLKRQKDGDEIDLDATVGAIADLSAGINPSDELFLRLKRDRRDIAAIFLIDLSGSTNGWINRMERDMLLILCEALSVLQDCFAIYGFSGNTRLRCELYRIKGFDEPYGGKIKARIMNLKAYEYTRLGPPIRYVTEVLSRTEARTRLLITLSDGKPDDYDGYRGTYGIEDTRQALIEAKRKGIYPFCITIDKAEHSYIKHMYGEINYIFIDEISHLPSKVPEIYRKLTT